jgi:Response regulators consisting of a CheY-like receiver domain and a winged-helix DNA-binding domain
MWEGVNLPKIFILEDDDNIRGMVMYALEAANFETEGFADDASLFLKMEESLPDLLLLDIMLPGNDGISILKEMRQTEKYKKMPIIMLTAKGTEYDRIKGLDLGADDYITKPFSVLEVISRIRAVLRRGGNVESENNDLLVGDIELSTSKHRVLAGKKEVLLTFKEFELLKYLMVNTGIVLTRDKLLEQVWEFEYNGESRTVDVHIKSLRQKLGKSGEYIKTVRNVGYKIEA